MFAFRIFFTSKTAPLVLNGIFLGYELQSHENQHHHSELGVAFFSVTVALLKSPTSQTNQRWISALPTWIWAFTGCSRILGEATRSSPIINPGVHWEKINIRERWNKGWYLAIYINKNHRSFNIIINYLTSLLRISFLINSLNPGLIFWPSDQQQDQNRKEALKCGGHSTCYHNTILVKWCCLDTSAGY